MFHATTVLAVRHNGQTVMASDGQVTFGDTVVKQQRPQDPPALQRPHPGRLRRVGRRFVRPVRPLRGQARAVPRQPRAVGRRARQGLAHPIASCAASKRCSSSWTASPRICSPATAISSSPTMGSWRSDRAARTRWPPRRRSPQHTRARRARHRGTGHAHRRGDLHLLERLADRSKCCKPDVMPIYLPETHHLDHPVADAAADRRRARQVRRRAAPGEARRRDRAAQSHAAAEAAAPRWRRRSRRRTS